ncbi:rna-lsm domain protein [Diplodia corticola]|uniref:Rna-lsm domain protein n=1 Tax=Diplodia corticola TaxID=236234 RepID=A0A1J9SC07_9PEZI|nr:rna-lsm domain protein [Diplodia corticola]OJD37117.1 rna-lsm domain protein [Diplodia corticola]
MADGKRLSSAGKVATPKLGDQSILNDSHLFKVIGKRLEPAASPRSTPEDALCSSPRPSDDVAAHTGAPHRVKITTTVANHVLEGTVFAADPVLNAVAVNTAPAPPNPSTNLATQPGNFHVVSIPNIQKFEILSDGAGADSFENATPTIASLDLGALKAREEAAVRKLLEKEEHRNREVSSEVQELYDAFNRTLPMRWHGTTMIINDAVLLGPPYTVNDLKAAEGKERNIDHIKRIMEGYLAKKRSGGANRPGVATPIPPRKGG